MLQLLKRIRVRDTVIIMLAAGSVGIAIADTKYREFFADLAQNGLTGYFALAQPGAKRDEGEEPPGES